MPEVLQLDNPIMINNESVSEVTCDPMEITPLLYAQADFARYKSRPKGVTIGSAAVEFDSSLHLYLGLMSILAVNPQYSLEDLERIKGIDVVDIMRIGRNFITRKSGGPSGPSDYEKPSGTTPESTTATSETLSESD